jgi:hypothetical protein
MSRFLLKPIHLLGLFALGLMLSQTASAVELALSDGEKMKFRVGWGIFRHAGELTIEADRVRTDEADHLRITTITASDGIVKAFYPFVATSEAYFDPKTGLLLHANDVSETKKKTTRQTLTLNYEQRIAAYVNENEPEKSADIEMPEGNPMDLMMSLVQTRDWDLKPGEKQDALILFDDEFYELTIYADRYEKLRTKLGKFKTLVLIPKMEKTEPKGMFKRGATVKVWVSQDEQRLPVRIEVKLKVGKGVMTLIEHQPANLPEEALGDKATEESETLTVENSEPAPEQRS